MQKVVSISLNGISYQLEEPGYDQLRNYLERAESRLKDSPDRAEVMADLEQAIGEKCRATAQSPQDGRERPAEVGTHHRGDGPGGIRRRKDGERRPREANAEPGAAAAPVEGPRRASACSRFAKARCGAGVCNGIAAYMGFDVTWVRIVLVAAHAVHRRDAVLRLHRVGHHRALRGNRRRSRRGVRRALQYRRHHQSRKKKL